MLKDMGGWSSSSRETMNPKAIMPNSCRWMRASRQTNTDSIKASRKSQALRVSLKAFRALEETRTEKSTECLHRHMFDTTSDKPKFGSLLVESVR